MSKLLGVEKPFQTDGLVSALNARRERQATNRAVDDYNALYDQYQQLLVSRNIERAAALARLAQFQLLLSQVTDVPCLQSTSQKYKDGKAKTVARLHFEEEFRKEARKLGVSEREINRTLDS